jgi:uncharacterized protein (DUF2252 family)
VQLTTAERRALGLAARKEVSRKGLAKCQLKGPLGDALGLLRAVEKDRIAALLRLKHQRMAASPFGFFRGAAPVMAADLATQPHTGLIAQMCGDAHVSNLGAFAAPDGNLAFDINDFDESLPGPFEWDLKRLVSSLLLAAREAGIRRSDREEAALHLAATYRRHMLQFATMPILEASRWQIHRLGKVPPMPAIFAQAERSTPARSLDGLTEAVAKGQRRFKTTPPVLTPLKGKERDEVFASLIPYARTLQPERQHFLALYKPVDVAFKVVGTGSVGLRDYCIYFEGTYGAKSDPLFLQIKEEAPSVYAPYLPKAAERWSHNGQRAMDGQRAMQLTSDAFLGFTSIAGRDYLVRQLNDHKASLDLTTLTARSLMGYADVCGELFARGHARSGDAVAMAAYMGDSGRFDEALLGFAHAYADRTEQYYEAFVKLRKR